MKSVGHDQTAETKRQATADVGALGQLLSDLRRDWLPLTALALLTASGVAILNGKLPPLLQSGSPLAAGCTYENDRRVVRGDELHVPPSVGKLAKERGEVTIVLAPVYSTCAEPVLDFSSLFDAARASDAVIVFDQSVEEADSAIFLNLPEELLVIGNDSVFLESSAARLYRPSAFVINADGIVLEALDYQEFIGARS